MPDTINKQTLINLLIDSPLREPIKINLIDIINNTSEPDLPKVYPTIVKELEIFQKATERRMKLADETIAKLNGNTQTTTMDSAPPATSQSTTPTTTPTTSLPPLNLPPLDLPPLPPTPTTPPAPSAPQTPTAPLSVPPLDLPPMPAVSAPTEPVADLPVAPAAPSSLPSPEPLGGPVATQSSDEAALAEIQKELESLKAGVAADANPVPPTAPQA